MCNGQDVGLVIARSWVQLPVGSLSSGYYLDGKGRRPRQKSRGDVRQCMQCTNFRRLKQER